jgi:multidrug resistance efflux pump
MDILILSVYTLFCWLLFKIFKVPVNKWTLTTAILGGVIFIAAILLLMNFFHPYTANSRAYFVSTPLISNVNSKVDSVYIKDQTVVKKGDTLFTLDNTAFISKVDALNASLRLARTRLAQSKRLLSARAGSAYDVQMYQAEIEKINAQLIGAKWELEQCAFLAPTDGLVTQQRLRPGMRAVQFPLKPLMTFIHSQAQFVVAAMPQNPIQNLEVGNDAEIIFDAIPGKIFKGKIFRIEKAIAQGELQTTGTLVNFDKNMPQGSIPILIKVTDDLSEYFIPLGAKTQVAIYSHHMEPVKLVRMVLIRMKGWLNYIFGEH